MDLASLFSFFTDRHVVLLQSAQSEKKVWSVELKSAFFLFYHALA
jgi:hypothetical protein